MEVATKTRKINSRKEVLKEAITAHLEKYQKDIEVFELLIDEAVFTYVEMEQLRTKIETREVDKVQVTKTGYSQKSGWMNTYESLLKHFMALATELGLSPKAIDKWKKKEEDKPKNKFIK